MYMLIVSGVDRGMLAIPFDDYHLAERAANELQRYTTHIIRVK